MIHQELQERSTCEMLVLQYTAVHIRTLHPSLEAEWVWKLAHNTCSMHTSLT
jgi:hypothetical protein